MRISPVHAVAIALLCPLVPAQEHKLLPSDGVAYDYFGAYVAISGTTAIVSAYGDGDNGSFSGSAYLFDAITGALIAKLLPSDGTTSDYFGKSVAVSGATAIVGAYYDDDYGSETGSAYLFDATTGAQMAKLLASDAAPGDYFGYSVAISGATAIVGAVWDDDSGFNSGSAYLFDASTGTQIAKLLPNDGASWDEFGVSVAISGTTAIVGADRDNANGTNSGSAYLFDTTTGTQLAKLLASDGASHDYFGSFVAISGGTAIVGAHGHGDNGANSGSAYLFDATTGAQIAKLLASDGSVGDAFGRSVSISGATAIVGAPGNTGENGRLTGSSYFFDTTTGAQVGKLLASDGSGGDWFGGSGAISGATAIVGAAYDSDNGPNSGSAYLFDTTAHMGSSFCLGDGSGTPCPCGNSGAPGEGCANDTGSGARLIASGSNSVLAAGLTLEATGLTPGPGLFFQGDTAIVGGQGSAFGDGLRCVGGQIVRLEVRFSSAGTSQTTISIAATGGVGVGDTKRYQLWYRDAGGSPCNSGFNLTNGYEITWTP
ncbi:MAG: FG-GAP repeat protein [bacterium]|nr:hypothetical protein [Planctomycetota bacterium]